MSGTLEWILASASPRRHRLLEELIPNFTVIVSDVEEWEPEEADPVEQVEENARRKGHAVATMHPNRVIISADTTVALGRQLFAKPRDREEAVAMLGALSGRIHRVVTGVAVCCGGTERVFSEESHVHFKSLSSAVIDAYLERVYVFDKAGAYAIQEHSDLIIERFEGDFATIMGLPVQRLRKELVQMRLLEGLLPEE
jgi:septum formation protein